VRSRGARRAAGARASAAALLAALALGAWAASAHEQHERPPAPQVGGPRFEPPAPGSYELPAIGRVRDHPVLESSGRSAPLLGLVRGELAFVSFIYRSCGDACPLANAALQSLDRALVARPELGRRVKLVTLSFDPARDTPERMAELAAQLAPRGRWTFATTPGVEQIRPILADFGQDAVALPDAPGAAPGQLGHVLKVFLVDARGAIRNVYSTGFLDPRLMLHDALTLTAEPAGT
jgi:cytochrome oxidase Cu insertion factor (SCO1/SenC/PrrC family)